MSEVRLLFGDDLPDELVASAYSLSELGSRNFAWKYDDIVKVIEYCSMKKLAILGGDVLCLSDSQIDFTYDSWYLNRDKGCWDDYVKVSAKKALEYVKNYESQNVKRCEVLLYSVVAENET